MRITNQNKQIEVKRMTGVCDFVNVHRVGIRRMYIDDNGQKYVKAFGKWWMFPQQIEY